MCSWTPTVSFAFSLSFSFSFLYSLLFRSPLPPLLTLVYTSINSSTQSMLPSQSCSGFEAHPKQQGPFDQPSSFVDYSMDGGDSILSSSASKIDEEKRSTSKDQTSCSRSHKEAERRRRQRINAHLSTLRSLLPNTTKTDKASLLSEVVHHVKELRRRVADVASQDSWPLFPGESDEATLSRCDDGGEANTVKVSVCCEDRPGLNRDLTRAIASVRGKAVRAEMTTVGGRTKSVVVVQCGGRGGGGDEDLEILRSALKAVVENRVSGSGLGPSRVVQENKRVRFCGLVGGGDDGFLSGK